MAYGSTAVIFTVELGPRHRDDVDETSRRYRPQSILLSDLFSNTRALAARTLVIDSSCGLIPRTTELFSFLVSEAAQLPQTHLVCAIARLLITILISSMLTSLIESESPFFPPMRAFIIIA